MCFFLFLWKGVQTPSTVWVNKNQGCDFPLDEDKSSYFHTFPSIPNLTSQTETSTQGRKNIKIRDCPMFFRRTWWKQLQMLFKMRTFYIKKCDLVRRPRACCTYLFVYCTYTNRSHDMITCIEHITGNLFIDVICDCIHFFAGAKRLGAMKFELRLSI